jgi:polar amino acid transport system substrate-binding protein
MTRPIGFRQFLGVAIVVAAALGGRAATAEPLRLVTFPAPPFTNLSDDKAPGLSVEVLRQVLAAMGRDVLLEEFPLSRGLMMVKRGERDGIFNAVSTRERLKTYHYPEEPLTRERWVFFIRTADAGRLKFSSLDDLVGHSIAVRKGTADLFSPSTNSHEMWAFMREHPDSIVEATDLTNAFRMLVAGRVDYVMTNLAIGMQEIAATSLSGRIEPLLSRSAIETSYYICFSKARVEPTFVEAFSHALKQFKETEAFQAIYRKYFP